MKQIIFTAIALLIAFSSCRDDNEVLVNSLDFSSPYDIVDDPSDPIQHHRFLIYEKYGVPVFFNDTVCTRTVGQAPSGETLYRYETLDLNWNFTSHSKASVTYTYDYITDDEIKEKALDIVDSFLAHASKPVRPFSIFLPCNFHVVSNGQDETPTFHSGFRTLVIPDANLVDKNGIEEFSLEILYSMVKARIMNNEKIVEKFGAVSGDNYGKRWSGLGCKWPGIDTAAGNYWSPKLMYLAPYAFPGMSALQFDTYGHYCVYMSFQNGLVGESQEELLEDFCRIRALVFSEIGRFGFICGDYERKNGSDFTASPAKVSTDLEYYIDTMLEIGSKEFRERYCSSPLVEEKFEILSDFINLTLELKY